MAATDPLPEPDRLAGAPHPRDTARVFGQAAAEAEFLDAFRQGRLHHAWMLTGARGLGKATLAWRIALFLLATPEEDGGGGGGLFGAPVPPQTLDIDRDHPVARRLRALAEPRAFLLRRAPNDKASALAQVITIGEVRRLRDFLGLSAADGGRRVVIVDSLDEMNVAAANGLLKMLEEPPKGVTFLLVSHQPARLLPTIRSRCRELRLAPLAPEALAAALAQAGADVAPGAEVALAELAGGSAGEAFRMTELDGLQLYARLVALLADLPGLDRPRLAALADAAAARGAAETFDLILALLDLFLSRLARAAASRQLPPEAAPGEAALFTRLAPDLRAARLWAEQAQGLTQRARRGKAVNLDPAALLMDILFRIDETAGQLATPG
ncbi:DNA polymerase III subunit delta' [Xinfangfangia pollutisoli]|uniref:DNA polymerase III subunit delta' n=1 Tax=Xinfangfangia pollutisoli TaxID=2865960 RepID=UPI001CD4E7AF|nr:DNA polymerase III subunit delta' [Xinfangfangia pollutisoli]